MKTIIVSIFIILAMISTTCLAVELTDEDYKDLDNLHNKIVKLKKELNRLMKAVTSETYVEDKERKSLFGALGEDIKVDVVENEKEIVVRADMPGMDKDKIDITLENNKMLRLAGTREVVKTQAGPDIVKQERMQGKFERVLELPSECMNDGIKASYKNGVLEVVIPKKEKVKEKAVKIVVQ